MCEFVRTCNLYRHRQKQIQEKQASTNIQRTIQKKKYRTNIELANTTIIGKYTT